MKAIEAFPRFCCSVRGMNHGVSETFGNRNLEWADDRSTDWLRNAIVAIQQRCGGNLDQLTEITTECLKDILELRRGANPATTLVLNLLQIDVSVGVMGTAYAQKRLQLIFDWAIYSVCDFYPYGIQNSFELSRIGDLFILNRPSIYAEWGREIGLAWLKIFYFYVFKVGGHKEVANQLAPFAISALVVLLPAIEAIDPAVSVADWAIRNQYSDRAALIAKLREAFDRSPVGSDLHLRLGISFSLLIGKDAGVDTKGVATKLLAEYGERIPANWRLQLSHAAFENDADAVEASFADIVQTIQKYRQRTLAVTEPSVLIEYEFERSFTLIAGLFVTCVKAGKLHIAAQLLAAWKGLQIGSAHSDLLLLIPNTIDGPLYAYGREVYSALNGNHDTTFVRLIEAINQFHGTNIVLDNDDSLQPHIPLRPGIADDPELSSQRYVTAMCDQFGFEKAKMFLNRANESRVTAFRVVPGLPCPVQPMLIRELGFSWPIASSMQQPKSDRVMRSVLIWNAGTFIGEQQAQWIMDAIGSTCKVHVCSGSIERFRVEYSNPSYDIIWVTTHGNFDHMDPHRSSLSLCENAELTFDELRRLNPPRVGRRLLVLDACDSGAVPMYGGLSDFGFGPQLASEEQAVISHRWPVEQFPSAMFNLLVATGLRSNSFYRSYESAISAMIGGSEAIAGVLSTVLGQDHDVVRRIRDNESIRWHTIAVWGSAAFFE